MARHGTWQVPGGWALGLFLSRARFHPRWLARSPESGGSTDGHPITSRARRVSSLVSSNYRSLLGLLCPNARALRGAGAPQTGIGVRAFLREPGVGTGHRVTDCTAAMGRRARVIDWRLRRRRRNGRGFRAGMAFPGCRDGSVVVISRPGSQPVPVLGVRWSAPAPAPRRRWLHLTPWLPVSA